MSRDRRASRARRARREERRQRRRELAELGEPPPVWVRILHGAVAVAGVAWAVTAIRLGVVPKMPWHGGLDRTALIVWLALLVPVAGYLLLELPRIRRGEATLERWAATSATAADALRGRPESLRVVDRAAVVLVAVVVPAGLVSLGVRLLRRWPVVLPDAAPLTWSHLQAATAWGFRLALVLILVVVLWNRPSWLVPVSLRDEFGLLDELSVQAPTRPTEPPPPRDVIDDLEPLSPEWFEAHEPMIEAAEQEAREAREQQKRDQEAHRRRRREGSDDPAS